MELRKKLRADIPKEQWDLFDTMKAALTYMESMTFFDRLVFTFRGSKMLQKIFPSLFRRTSD